MITPQGPVLPDGVLYNLALDVSPTPLVCVASAGISFAMQDAKSKVGEGGGAWKILRDLYLSTDVAAKDTQKSNEITALVLPVFSDGSGGGGVDGGEGGGGDDELKERDIEGEGEEEESVATTTSASTSPSKHAHTLLHPYPSPHSNCGSQQSSSLVHAWPFESSSASTSSSSSSSRFLTQIETPTSELLKEHTVLLPVFFDKSRGQHGNNFVRFAEEISGRGCFGTFFLRALVGAGFVPRWSAGKTRDEKSGVYGIHTKMEEGGGACGCVHVSEDQDPNIVRSMLAKFNRFLERASTVRKNTYKSLYSKKPFGGKFEEEQRVLLAKQETKAKSEKQEERQR